MLLGSVHSLLEWTCWLFWTAWIISGSWWLAYQALHSVALDVTSGLVGGFRGLRRSFGGLGGLEWLQLRLGGVAPACLCPGGSRRGKSRRCAVISAKACFFLMIDGIDPVVGPGGFTNHGLSMTFIISGNGALSTARRRSPVTVVATTAHQQDVVSIEALP